TIISIHCPGPAPYKVGRAPSPLVATRFARPLLPARSKRQLSSHFQLFVGVVCIVTGSVSSNVSGVSGRRWTSFFPVINATAVPAPAPTGPPISAPLPPPASAPINAPPPAPPPINAQLRFLWLPPTLRDKLVRTSYSCPFTSTPCSASCKLPRPFSRPDRCTSTTTP